MSEIVARRRSVVLRTASSVALVTADHRLRGYGVIATLANR